MKILLSTIGGGILGVIIIVGMMIQPFSSWIDSSRLFGIVHYPAGLFLKIWHAFRLPPHGDVGFVMIPVSVLIQWLVIGIIFGIVLQFRHRRERPR